MIQFEGIYYDGIHSKGNNVLVSVDALNLTLMHPDFSIEIPLSQITFDPIVGSAKNVIRLKNGAELHSDDFDKIGDLINKNCRSIPDTFANLLENRLLYALSALVFTTLFMIGLLRWGIPSLTHYAVNFLPLSVERTLAVQTLELLDSLYLAPTQLDTKRQVKIKQKLKQLCQRTECPSHTLIFRNSQIIGANAFALPGNQMIITDQLIEKAKNEDEILAVLSHELGHIQHKHIMRMMLQSIGSGVVLVMITGDISNYSDLAAGLPAILLQQGYSRDMENEADQFALQTLKNAHISPHHFANILMRIAPKEENHTTLFSSHPDTSQRIKLFLQTQ